MWNYRMVEMVAKYGDEEDVYYEIREVYYDTNGIPYGHCSANICGETKEDLESTHILMAQAFLKDTLKEEDFTGDVYE